MQGSLSESSTQAVKQMLPSSLGGTLEYTRCVRTDGSAYGTGGKCRKGVEQATFETDGGIPTGASGGVIGGRLFRTAAPMKTPKAEVKSPGSLTYKKIQESVEDARKRGFLRNRKRMDSFLGNAEALFEREDSLKKEGARDNAFSTFHDPVIDALNMVWRNSYPDQSFRAKKLLEKIEQSGALHGLI